VKSCPKCNSSQADEEAKFCSSCGTSFTSTSDDKHHSPKHDDDKLDFVVTEKDNDDREFVGGQKDFGPENDLGVETPEDILEREATSSIVNPPEALPHTFIL